MPNFAKSENVAKVLLSSAKLPNSAPAPSHGFGSRTKAKPASADPKADKRMEKIYKIQRYMESFEKVRNLVVIPSNLANLSEAELDQILFSIQRVLNSSSPEQMIPVGITTLFSQIENVTMNYQFNPLNLDLTGLSRVSTVPENTAKLSEIAKELYIKYEHLFSFGPESRFFMEIIGLLVTVDRYNKVKNIPVSQEDVNEMEEKLNKQPQ
jgi:hypothetical protein